MEPSPTTNGNRKPIGGRRPGAGRRPVQQLAPAMQIGVPLTEEEAAAVRQLTPQERAERLADATDRRAGADQSERRQYIFRVALPDDDDRERFLALSSGERRARLLRGAP